MPIKSLPNSLVKRLRARVAKESRQPDKPGLFDRARNLDHRGFSNRVVELNVSRYFPGVRVAIKKTHGYTAQDTINIVKRFVRDHNASANPRSYVLVAPKAYAIGQYLLAMAKTNKPSVCEIIGDSKGAGKTQRGKQFFELLKQKYGIEESALNEAFNELAAWKRKGAILKCRIDNVLLLGFRKGRFVFMPLLDVY